MTRRKLHLGPRVFAWYDDHRLRRDHNAAVSSLVIAQPRQGHALTSAANFENAAKYTPNGGTIWIKATTEGNEAIVRVQDTGVGIAPELMPHIFDLFTQAEFANHSQGGLGIGLSVVKDTIAQHGGTVQAASDGPGKGSEFTIRLPLAGKEQSRP
jgi:K+-sensing histidine kinase KdpD